MAKRTNWVARGVVSMLAVAVVSGARFTRDSWSAPLLKRDAQSPTGLGAASLVTDNSSFAGSDAWGYATDPKRITVPVLLGGSYASDGPVKMHDAIWSRDGSVLAVRARVGENAGRHFQGRFAMRYVAAYDYRRHQVFTAAEPTVALSERIDQLLSQRGGKRLIVFRNPYDASGKPVPTREARHLSHPCFPQ